MSSKLEKQKQIFALLNSKFDSKQAISQVIKPVSKPEGDHKTAHDHHVLLINRVYHFYKSIIQNINHGLLTTDLKGEITFSNKNAATLLGYDVEELLNRNVGDFFSHPEDAERFLKLLSIPGKKIDDWEVRFRKKNGQEFIVGLSTSPIKDENNKFEGIVVLFRDLTEVHHLRNQVERMERLALLGELSAGIAHEIRNPLAGIKAAAQVLEDSFGADDFRLQLVSRIVREVDKANRLLKEFFKFARPTKPRFGFHDIEMIVDSVYLLLAPRFKKYNIDFVEDLHENLPQVYVDDTQIEQVILNLFLNAIDAMPKGGKLKVSACKKRINLLPEEREKFSISDQDLYYVLLEISDTGVGIPEENLSKIFNPFFTTKPEGLGLGLSICSRLIEENRGKIDVVSSPQEGTTFIIALPTFVHR